MSLHQRLHAGAVELDLEGDAAEPGVLVAVEVDDASVLIDLVELLGVPVAAGDGVLELAVGGVVVEVLVAGAFAEEQKRAVLEESDLPDGAEVADPGLVGIAKELPRLAGGTGCHAEIEPRLDAVLGVEVNLLAVRRPADARDQEVLRIIGAKVGPRHRAVAHPGDADLHGRVGRAGFRIGRDLWLLPHAHRVVDDGEFTYIRVVETQKRQMRRVGAPPDRVQLARGHENFLLIDGVGPAVEDHVAAVASDAPFGFRRLVHEV